jgi:hypothetical protein
VIGPSSDEPGYPSRRELASLYRAELDGLEPFIVRLLPTWEEITQRTASRPLLLTWDEIQMLYEQQSKLGTYDMTIDNSEMTPEAVTDRLDELLDPASPERQRPTERPEP